MPNHLLAPHPSLKQTPSPNPKYTASDRVVTEFVSPKVTPFQWLMARKHRSGVRGGGKYRMQHRNCFWGDVVEKVSDRFSRTAHPAIKPSSPTRTRGSITGVLVRQVSFFIFSADCARLVPALP